MVNMDRPVRASVTSWVGISRHSALGLILGAIASGGLSVPRLAKVVPLLQRNRLQSLARSAGGDEVLAAVIKTEYYGKLVARLLKAVKVGTAGVVVTSRQQVDAEYFRRLKEDAPDGCVARGIDFNVKSGCWLSMAHFLGQISGGGKRLPRGGGGKRASSAPWSRKKVQLDTLTEAPCTSNEPVPQDYNTGGWAEYGETYPGSQCTPSLLPLPGATAATSAALPRT